MRPDTMVNQILDHYRIIKPIGHGGMATVFLAQDIYLQRNVAIKIFESGTDESGMFWRRFAREAQVVAQLDHPNILMVHEYGEHNGLAYFIMPYLELGSLRDLLRRHKILPLHETISIITQILQALQYAHERGLIHRDIKPDNILFKTEKTPVLSDFGLVKVNVDGNESLSNVMTHSGVSIVGTPQYMAPEQIQGKPTFASDIYSVGVVLYEMLTGMPPFVADNAISLLTMHLYKQPRPLRELNPTISPALEAIVLHALEKDEAARFKQPVDFLQALAHAPYNSDPFATNLEISSEFALPVEAGNGSMPQFVSESQFPTLHTQRTPQNPQEIGTSNEATSTHIIHAPAARHKTSVFPRALLIGLLVAIVALASLGAWYGIPYLQAKRGGSGLIPIATSKPSSSTSTMPGHASISAIPAPQTSCPVAGTARAAVLPPILGTQENHQDIVYGSYRSYQTQAIASLVRYDSVNGKQTTITEIPSAQISEAQVSADGQWILFVDSHFQTAGDLVDSKLQMVRIDGQELQTLYCAPANSTVQKVSLSPFSYNASGRLIFSLTGQQQGLYVLNLNSGMVLREIQTEQPYEPIGWAAPDSVYLRDTTASHNVYQLVFPQDDKPSSKNLRLITASSTCDDFSTSTNGFSLYNSHCNGTGASGRFCSGNCATTQGPSKISIWSRDDTAQQYQQSPPLYTDPTMAVVQIRIVSNQALLALVANTDANQAKNGVWKIDMTTEKWQMLLPDTFPGAGVMLNMYTQSPWSNVSRDGHLYAMRVASPQALGYDALYLGSMNGGNSLKFASSSDGSQLFIVGWTTM